MTQGPIQIGPAGPDPDEILQALRRALRDDPGAREREAEDVSRDLAQGGYLPDEPDPLLVAEMLGVIEAEDGAEGP